MCGIAGIFDLRQQREPDRDLLAAMNQTQFHRGPDEGGVHTEPGVGLAHRRLSIIDLVSGQQVAIGLALLPQVEDAGDATHRQALPLCTEAGASPSSSS